MKRASRFSQSPTEPTPMIADIVQPLLDAHDAGELLGGISESQVDQLRESAGLPAVDLSVGDPTKRKKGLWRYDPVAVRAWWQKRQSGDAA
jgi:hypothetical protein